MSPALAQRGIALAAVALLAVVVVLAIASRDGSSAMADLPERVGDWYHARAAPMDLELEGTTTACGVRLAAKALGITDPVLPCGSKIYIGFRDQDVLTQVIAVGPGPGGVRFALTPISRRPSESSGRRPIRWGYAREGVARRRACSDGAVLDPVRGSSSQMLNQHHCKGSPRPASLQGVAGRAPTWLVQVRNATGGSSAGWGIFLLSGGAGGAG